MITTVENTQITTIGAVGPAGPAVTFGTEIELSSGVKWISGEGSPEAAVEAPVGSIYTRTDGSAGATLYVKESGTGNEGWAAK